MKNRIKYWKIALSLILVSLCLSCDNDKKVVLEENNVIEIREQGSFAVGGEVIQSPGTFDPVAHGFFNPTNQNTEGQTLHGDHATVFYQIPTQTKELPMVFWHGYGQSMRTWQTTPDGREGFQTIFLRKGFPIYLLDQPRRGFAGQSL